MIDFSAITRRSRLLGRILRTPLNLIPHGTVVPILQGYLRGKKWIVNPSLHSFWLGSYEIDKSKIVIEEVQSGDVFYDIGANVGYYSLLASYLVGDSGYVYGFEPFPAVARYAIQHLQINGRGNARIQQIAIAAQDGTAAFKVGVTDGMGKLDDSGELTVQTVKLDTLLQDSAYRPPTVMKIDVEGAEYDVLRGGEATLRRYHPLIFLATHNDPVHARCVEFLTGLGYQLESLRSIDGGGELLARFPQ
jgi:FkbM family methyltransferase